MAAFGFMIVKVRVLVPPTAIGSGAKFFEIEGGEIAAGVFVGVPVEVLVGVSVGVRVAVAVVVSVGVPVGVGVSVDVFVGV